MSLPDQNLNSDLWSENLQESIQAAGRYGKTLFCFVSNGSDRSKEWKDIIEKSEFRKELQASTIRLHLRKDSQEFGFLTGVCPIQHLPALVLIKNGQIEEKLEDTVVTLEEFKTKLAGRYASTIQGEDAVKTVDTDTADQFLQFVPSTGRMRLPNNAYDVLRERTEKLQAQKISAKNILLLQLRLMDNIPAMKTHVKVIRSRPAGTAPTLPEDLINRLLNTPASMLQVRQDTPSSTQATTASSSGSSNTSSLPTSTMPAAAPVPSAPPLAPSDSVASSAITSQSTESLPNLSQPLSQQRTPSPSGPDRSKQKAQRADYIRQQREREAAQKAERERIKAQIKADREERRRLDTVRKQGELATLRQENSTAPQPASTDIRIQVRTFDGSTLRTTFTKTATITSDIRPWIDETNPDATKVPYNLKLILTPLPNRNIEMEEEEMVLPELGIVGSATLIMVPVKGYVDSYAASSSGVVGSVIGGVTGVVGSVFSGALGILGWGNPPAPTPSPQSASNAANPSTAGGEGVAGDAATSGSTVKVRTLADQRAEEAKRRGNQLYNGNSLDFQGRKDDDKKDD